MGEETDLYFTVNAEDAGSASRQAQMLERLLLEECPGVSISRIRTESENMDGGATLVLAALASPVLVEVVKAVRAFVMQRRSSKIVVKKGTSSFIVDGASDRHVNALLDFLSLGK